MRAPLDETEIEEVKKLAASLSDVVNDFDNTRMELLISEMAQAHRTLQQGHTRFALGWLHYLCRLSENDYDLRNRASVLLAKRIDKAVDLKSARRLPVL